MNYIVLTKQVPDVRHIPNEAWDWEKGTLKRGLLENVCNELDKQALAFAVSLKQQQGGILVSLTMGPPFAEEILRYALSVGADEGVLLTDRKMGGADTAATAYPLSQAIRKIEKEIFKGNRDYIIISGMQSVDGDTAQVPAQVAEELGVGHIAYATDFNVADSGLNITRITGRGSEVVSPVGFPCVITVVEWTEPLNATFSRTRWAYTRPIIVWSAGDVEADESRIGVAGSKTTVFKIFSPKDTGKRECNFGCDLNELLVKLRESYHQKKNPADRQTEESIYQLPEGKKPEYKGEVWVYAEQEGGEINPVSYELLGKAVELAGQLGEKACAVIAGYNIKDCANELIAYGASKVYVAEHQLLNHFSPVPYTKVVSEMVIEYKPQLLLFGATPLGRELAPRVAYRLKSGLTADCTSLNIFDFVRGNQESAAVLKQTRPALGGNIMASIVTQNSVVQMSTIRPGVMSALVPDYGNTGEVVEYVPSLCEKDLKTTIISREEQQASSGLKDAGVIVSGGAGCRTRENYEKFIKPLSQSFGSFLGEVCETGASRAAVELGFIDRGHQVGQTGQTVKPRVYVAVGISGAVQHLTGMQNSDIILAINKDSKAPIFKAADFGIVGNIEEVVPELVKLLARQGESCG